MGTSTSVCVRNAAAMSVSNKYQRTEGDLEETLCGCCSDKQICCTTLFCMCCIMGANRANVDGRRMVCADACTCLPCSEFATRQTLRAREGLRERPCHDFWCS